MPVNQAPAVTEPPDDSAWLVAAGIFEMLLGCLCLFLVMLISREVAAHYKLPHEVSDQEPGPTALAQPLAIFAGAALAFFWLGIGLVRAQRWAWSMTVAWSWVWLVFGIFVLPFFVFLYGPAMWDALGGHGDVAPRVVTPRGS